MHSRNHTVVKEVRSLVRDDLSHMANPALYGHFVGRATIVYRIDSTGSGYHLGL